MDLPIDVGFGNVVHVDQRQSCNATAGQRFSRPGAYPANTDHHHMRLPNALGTRHTI